MAHLPYPSADDPMQASYLAKVVEERNGQQVANLFRMLGHNTALAEAWLLLGSAVRYGTTLTDEIRELAICQVAATTGAAYELVHHEPLARRAGVPDALLEALPDWAPTRAATDSQRLVLRFVDAALAHTVDKGLVEELSAMLGDRQIAELTATVGYYRSIAVFVQALDVDLDG